MLVRRNTGFDRSYVSNSKLRISRLLMMGNDLLTFFRPEILSLSAYSVADPRGMIKLDAMENPYAWPESIQQEWLDSLRHCPLNRYPDPEAQALQVVLRKFNAIPEQAGLLLGNGSDEIIQILLMSLAPGACILAPEPGFVMYKQVAQTLGLGYCGVPLLTDSFDLDRQAMLNAIKERRPAIIFLAFPNNPTGNLFNPGLIHEMMVAAPGLVVIDEAYAPFAKASFMDQLVAHERLLVMRTLSKLGLAGLRLGFLAGRRELLEQLNKIRLPYNINSLTQATALFALNHGNFLHEQTQIICAQRALVLQKLQAMDRIIAYPSAANFILFRIVGGKADDVFNALKHRGILIKNLCRQRGLLENCLRVTIGAPQENQAFLLALESILYE
jgi:histidinol-phosphate aminotransferase